ncbi:hypothetical protein AOLI_G00211020 [Acnodon oligacanthus]
MGAFPRVMETAQPLTGTHLPSIEEIYHKHCLGRTGTFLMLTMYFFPSIVLCGNRAQAQGVAAVPLQPPSRCHVLCKFDSDGTHVPPLPHLQPQILIGQAGGAVSGLRAALLSAQSSLAHRSCMENAIRRVQFMCRRYLACTAQTQAKKQHQQLK